MTYGPSADETPVRASLLDRLVDLRPGSSDPPAYLRRREPTALMESVRRDLEHLLSTRCRVPERVRLDRGRSVLEYGVQDLSHLSTSSPEDCLAVARAIKEAVEACEPRLRRVSVDVVPHPDRVAAYEVHLQAQLATEEIEQTVSFPFVVHR